MVATKLSEVMSKGIEWAYGSGGSGVAPTTTTTTTAATNNNPALPNMSTPTTPIPSPTTTTASTTDLSAASMSSPATSATTAQQQQPSIQQLHQTSNKLLQQQSSPTSLESTTSASSSWYSYFSIVPDTTTSYLNYASDTLNEVVTKPIYSNLEDAVHYFYSDSTTSSSSQPSSSSSIPDVTISPSTDTTLQQQQQQPKRRYRSSNTYSTDLSWMLKNPNIGVRGRDGCKPSALPAVRSLLVAVDQYKRSQQEQQQQQQQQQQPPSPIIGSSSTGDVRDETQLPSSSSSDSTKKRSSSVLSGETPGKFPDPLPPPHQRQQSMESLPSHSGGDEFDNMNESWTAGTTTAAVEDYDLSSSQQQRTQRLQQQRNHHQQQQQQRPVSNSETASLLAEGTLRSLRDFALDEAVELNAALQYWTIRWEMPFLSWLEAGPQVWFSKEGYNHQEVGHKVSQIQAVLARRCSAIGQLQQHLLRAGWQRGVAQWGVLGQGGRWAPVAAFHTTSGRNNSHNNNNDNADNNTDLLETTRTSPQSSIVGDDSRHHYHQSRNDSIIDNSSQCSNFKLPDRLASEISETSQTQLHPDESTPLLLDRTEDDPADTTMSHISNVPPHGSIHENRAVNTSDYYYGHGNVFVRNTHGGTIVTDDPAWAEWSVDAVRLIRIHLNRAANGLVKLPCADNWKITKEEHVEPRSQAEEETGQLIVPAPSHPHPSTSSSRPLPSWARFLPPESKTIESSTSAVEDDTKDDNHHVKEDETGDSQPPRPSSPTPPQPKPKIYIWDLKLLATEISELINAMEYVMTMQRSRRLDKLKPMGWLRRNWYFAVAMTPMAAYLTKTLVRNNYGKELAIFLLDKLAEFFQEHVTGPLTAIWDQLFRGRPTISDRKALAAAIETLKAMILTWLTENHRDMPEAERLAKAQAMDVAWIDKTKEESMKSVLEGVNVVRMSFIQMQFIYKEVLNALVAMDDIIESNWINMNLAAVTPAILALYGVQWVSRVLYYVLLKLGKTREETFASFRQIILDIERLLVMRDNPPFAPPPISWGGHDGGSNNYYNQPSQQQQQQQQPQLANISSRRSDTLSADDLGMLMLHIHECRTILWKDGRRFSGVTIRNVAEDLAELAGERGAVSVQQQIQIVSRMCRTYPFLKVLSAGTPFQLSAVHTHAV